MNDKILIFSANQLIVDGRPAQILDFDPIENEDLQPLALNSTNGVQEILSVKKVLKGAEDDRFIKIYIEDGNKYPYSKKVINSSNLKEEDNPRSPNKIELTDQLFALIDIKTSRIFLSNQKQKNEFIEWLQKKTKRIISIKPLFLIDEFIKKVKSIKEICLTVVPNLFNSNSDILSKKLVDDIYGFGAEEATLKLMYKRKNEISKNVLEKVKLLTSRKKEFKNITIVGRTSNNFESIFNMNEVMNRIRIPIKLDQDTKKLGYSEVFFDLIKKIKDDEQI